MTIGKTGALLAGAAAVWCVCALSAATHAAVQVTTNDGVYSKAQADAAKPAFEEFCAQCHAFTVATQRRPQDFPLGDEPFFKKWEGRALSELVTSMVLTMPQDGATVLEDDQALNLLAYMLQQNGFKAGDKPLTQERASAVIARPVK